MEPDRCSFCKGRLIKGETEFIVRVGSELLVIRDIPAYVCEECGEAYYTPDISRRIDRIMERFHESKLLVHPIAAGELGMREDIRILARLAFCPYEWHHQHRPLPAYAAGRHTPRRGKATSTTTHSPPQTPRSRSSSQPPAHTTLQPMSAATDVSHRPGAFMILQAAAGRTGL